MQNRDKYFGEEEADELVSYLEYRSQAWFQSLITSDYIDKIRRSWEAHHGVFYENSHDISFGGEQGELVQMPVNHYSNIAQNILTMVTATRPSFQAKAINTDLKSQIQTNLANGLLDFYMRDKRLEQDLKRCVEYAIIMGSGYLKMEWNATSGEIYDTMDPEYEYETDPVTGEEIPVIDEETGEHKIAQEGYPIYEGDVEFTCLSVLDVVFDTTKETPKQDWQLARSFKNKFDLAAKYPEFEQEIIGLKTKSDNSSQRLSLTPMDETVDVPVYEFFHRRSESLPQGRYVLYLSKDIILVDTVLPYRKLPIFRISPRDILGTPFGTTNMFDLLPLQKGINSLYSTAMTNNHTFGVQNIVSARGAGLTMTELAGGLNHIEVDDMSQIPVALQLTATSAECYNLIADLVRQMEVISGVNAVARGNPDPKQNLRSGNALALIQSQALQFISGLQQSYIHLIEDVGTNLVTLLQDFANVPRIAQIAGKSNASYMKEFTGGDLSSINRVVVDAGNALAQCLEKGTEVLMHDGTIAKVEDIRLGDLVMGPDSKPRTVGNINSGDEMMYKVISKDKHRHVSYGCNESHILTLKYCSDDHRYDVKKGDILDISVREYQKLPKRHKRLLQGFRTAVEFEQKALTVPAYILGSWLGDGTSACTAITSMDSEIVTEWSNYASSLGLTLSTSTSNTSGKARTYHITSGQANGRSDRNPFMNELRSMELIDNKHIPHIYLTSDRKDRLELLAGLIDTDGSRIGETYVFTQKSDKIASQVDFLAKSLGFRSNLKKKKTFSSEMVPKEVPGEINCVTIGGNTWEIPCRLPRKQCQPTEKQKDWLNYGINVVPVAEGTYFGFTLVEEPHFVLGDFTVTHNTTAGRVEMATQLIQMGIIKTSEEYISVMNTGKLETLTESQNKQLLLIRAENERLIEGKMQIRAIITDEHDLHIREHQSVLADPDLRMDGELVERATAHLQEHIDILSNPANANLLMSMKQQPIMPPAAPMPPPGAPNAQGAPAPAPEGGSPDQLMSNPQAQDVSVQSQQGALPNPSQPPQPFSDLPQNGQELFNLNTSGKQ